LDGEDKLILRIARALPSAVGLQRPGVRARTGVALGIGDDAAILASDISRSKPGEWVVTTDAFLEGVHFLADLHPADAVGYKALVRATSDLAGMGARPRLFLLTVAIPRQRTGIWLNGFLRGMGRAARELGVLLAGGDTSNFGSVAISLTVLGEVARGKAVGRSGARPGDLVYVSGTLGRARFGLELLRGLRGKGPLSRRLRSLLQPHLCPSIRLKLGVWLAEHGIASAMMDLSDGLSTDLGRLCVASSVGARIWAERVPRVAIPSGQVTRLKTARLNPLAMALDGGDDYELLFTVPKRKAKRLRGAPGFSELVAIGEIERGGRVLLVDYGGRSKTLRAGGWDSFREK
jgi:thiamine-monophosphate kinase